MATVTFIKDDIEIEAEVEYANMQIDEAETCDPIVGNMRIPIFSNVPVSIRSLTLKPKHSLSSRFLNIFLSEVREHILNSEEIRRQLNALPVPNLFQNIQMINPEP